MKSLEEIDEIINETFDKYGGEMNLKEFTEIVTEKNSEVFLQILCFLYEQIPFSPKNIDAMKTKYSEIKDDDFESISETYRKNKKSSSIRIKTPKHSTLLSPAGIFLKKFEVRKLSLNESDKNVTAFCSSDKNNKKISVDTTKESEANISINSSKTNSANSPNVNNTNKDNQNIPDDLNLKKTTSDPYNKNIDIVRLDNDNYLENKNNEIFVEKKNIKQIVEQSRNRYTSPTKYLQDKSYFNHLAISNSLNKDSYKLDNQLGPINENEDENENNRNDENSLRQIMDDFNDNINYENWVYKITESGRLRKFFLVLVNKDTYYYKNELNHLLYWINIFHEE